MTMTYLLLTPPDAELEKRLRQRFPATFGSLRTAKAANENDTREDDRGAEPALPRDSLIPAA